MKKALISSIEYVVDNDGNLKGNRIVDIQSAEFEVHESLYWIDCEDDVTMEHHYYDGKNCKTKDWIIIPTDEEIASANVRHIRNGLLKDSDLIVTRHYEMGTPVPQEWVEYRQALRDIPLQEGFPFDVVYPTKPAN